jgi:PilZ domain-containing protein
MAEGGRRKPSTGPSATNPSATNHGEQAKRPAKGGAAREPAGAERRKHPRVTASFPLKIVNEAGREEPFHLLDLSECGARIQCSHAVPPMTRIQVALQLPGKGVGLGKGVRVDTSGVIVWCHRISDGQYDTGVFFPDLEEEQRGLLRALVQATK